MKLELKSLKVAHSLSQETTAFTATLYVDGKKAAHVENHGTGGSHNIHWLERGLREPVEAFAKEQDTEYDFEQLDHLIDQLIMRQQYEKQLRGWMKKSTLFRLKTDTGDGWRTVKGHGPNVDIFILRKYGDQIGVMLTEETFDSVVESDLRDAYALAKEAHTHA